MHSIKSTAVKCISIIENSHRNQLHPVTKSPSHLAMHLIMPVIPSPFHLCIFSSRDGGGFSNPDGLAIIWWALSAPPLGCNKGNGTPKLHSQIPGGLKEHPAHPLVASATPVISFLISVHLLWPGLEIYQS